MVCMARHGTEFQFGLSWEALVGSESTLIVNGQLFKRACLRSQFSSFLGAGVLLWSKIRIRMCYYVAERFWKDDLLYRRLKVREAFPL